MTEEETFTQQPGTSSIKLIKNSKGYNWEIKIYNENESVMLANIEDADTRLRELYGGEDGKQSTAIN